MKSILISDIHLHPHGGKKERLTQTRDILMNLAMLSIKNDWPIVFGGDLVHKDGYIPKEVIDIIDQFLRTGCMVYAISGNHDQKGYNYREAPSITFLSSLTKFDNFMLLDDASEMLEPMVRLHGIPYYHRSEDFYLSLDERVEEVKYIGGAQKHILILHQTPDDLIDLDIPEQINLSDPRFDHFDLVLMGHIHKKQVWGDKFYMIGNLSYVDITDLDTEKGIYILDTSDMSMNFVETFYEESPVDLNKDFEDQFSDESNIIVNINSADGWLKTLSNYCQERGATESQIKLGEQIMQKCLQAN